MVGLSRSFQLCVGFILMVVRFNTFLLLSFFLLLPPCLKHFPPAFHNLLGVTGFRLAGLMLNHEKPLSRSGNEKSLALYSVRPNAIGGLPVLNPGITPPLLFIDLSMGFFAMLLHLLHISHHM